MFDLNDLIPHNDLSSLDAPFTNDEIDEVIKHMPNHKVPWPDGFNGKFIKSTGILSKGNFMNYAGNSMIMRLIFIVSTLPILL
jgi:hypothetical protein